jgi:alkaline phosphatase D
MLSAAAAVLLASASLLALQPTPSPAPSPTAPKAPAAPVENIDAPFHTTPPQPLPALVRTIALGSCLQQARPAPVLEVIADQQPDLFVWLGDNIYGDSTDERVFRTKYHQLARQSSFQKLRATTPQLAIWDDHDYGDNDDGREYTEKPMTRRLFAEFWDLPSDSPAISTHEGIYRSTILGPEGRRVQFILLDTRTNRSPLVEHGKGVRASAEFPGPYAPTTDPAATVLGEAQWAWLEAELRKPAEVRLIASSIQFVGEEARYERWANFPAERLRFIRLINSTGASGVIFASGDRHRAELSELRPGRATLTPPTPERPELQLAPADAQPAYPLWDLTASNMNQGPRPVIPEKNSHRRGELICAENFGWIAIGWDEPGVPIKLQIRDTAGRVQSEQIVKLETLRAK